MVEQLIFIVISVIMFGCIFFKVIKTNDTSYVTIMALEALGIAIDLIFLLEKNEMSIILKIITYLISIVLPLIIIILEKKNVSVMHSLKMIKVKIYLLTGNTKKAKDALIEILQKNENNYEAHKKLAMVYEQEGGIRKAMEEYIQCIDINKQDYDSYYKVATMLTDLDRKDEAIEMFTNLLSKKPEYTTATMALGDLLIEKERYKEATTIYLEALANDPLNYNLNYSLGIVYTMLNDFKSAKEYYEKAAEINNLSYNSKYCLGEIALLYKELDKAEQYFTQIIDSEELSSDGYYELAKIELMKGDKDSAIKYANVAIDLDGKRISEKIKREPLFMTVMSKISIPFNFEEKEDECFLSDKERKAKEHLEETQEITNNMGYGNKNIIEEIEKQNQIEKD